jgi:hypothetical protein
MFRVSSALFLLLSVSVAQSSPAGKSENPGAVNGGAPLLLAQVSTMYGKQEGRRIAIVIKPGSDNKEIPIKTERVFPIAILGSARFDVTLVNPRTIRVTSASKKLVGRSDTRTCRREDINADDYADLICDVKTAAFKLDPGELVLTLEAETYEREKLLAEGTIVIVD